MSCQSSEAAALWLTEPTPRAADTSARCRSAKVRTDGAPAQGHRQDQAGSPGEAQGIARRGRLGPEDLCWLHRAAGHRRLAAGRSGWSVRPDQDPLHGPDGFAERTDRKPAPRSLSAGDVRWALQQLAPRFSRRSLQITRNCLGRAIRLAQANDLVDRNVASLVSLPKGREGRPSKSFTVEEAQALLAASKGRRLHAYMTLSLLLGLRTDNKMMRSSRRSSRPPGLDGMCRAMHDYALGTM
jgi:hypothetical protein